MSQSIYYQFLPPPVELPPMRAGEIDGRYIDCTPDLGPVEDFFTGMGSISLEITRQDGQGMGAGDLQLATTEWPSTLDTTGLIVTFGFIAPPESANVCYNLKFTANPTNQGRIFIRDLYIPILGRMG